MSRTCDPRCVGREHAPVWDPHADGEGSYVCGRCREQVCVLTNDELDVLEIDKIRLSLNPLLQMLAAHGELRAVDLVKKYLLAPEEVRLCHRCSVPLPWGDFTTCARCADEAGP